MGIARDDDTNPEYPENGDHRYLLRIDPYCLAGRDAEELGIEKVDLSQKSAATRVHFSNRFRVGIIKPIHIPTIGRYFTDCIKTTTE